MPLVETAGRELNQAAIWIGPALRLRTVQMPSEKEVRVRGQEPSAVRAIREVCERVMDQGDTHARKWVASSIRTKPHYLILSE
jgi:hypothetical protein